MVLVAVSGLLDGRHVDALGEAAVQCRSVAGTDSPRQARRGRPGRIPLPVGRGRADPHLGRLDGTSRSGVRQWGRQTPEDRRRPLTWREQLRTAEAGIHEDLRPDRRCPIGLVRDRPHKAGMAEDRRTAVVLGARVGVGLLREVERSGGTRSSKRRDSQSDRQALHLSSLLSGHGL